MNDADLLKPYLDLAAAHLLWSKHATPLDLKRLRTALRLALTREGMTSMRVRPEHDPVLIAYFDAHEGFARISEGPEWVLKVRNATTSSPGPA